MLQKVTQMGNSYAVIIPKNIVKSFGLKKGVSVNMLEEPKKGRLILDFNGGSDLVNEVVDKEVYKVAKQLLRRYLPAFKELANK